MNQLFDYKKEQTQQQLRKLIFEEEDDPFGISNNEVKTLERGRMVPSLEDGLLTGNEIRKGIENENVVRLVSPAGENLVSRTKASNQFEKESHQDRLALVTEGRKKKEPEKGFWEMKTPEVTDEVKRELEILSMRGYWDPKSFFKGSRKKKELPKEFEFGRVVAGPFEGRKNRLTRREKKASFADELVSDVSFKERSEVLLEKERSKQKKQKKRR